MVEEINSGLLALGAGLGIHHEPAGRGDEQALGLLFQEVVGDVAPLEGGAQLLEVGVGPVALGDEGGLAVGEGCHLGVVIAVDQDVRIGVVVQHLQVVGKCGQALLVHFALEGGLVDGVIVVIQVARVEGVEHVLAGDPPEAAGHGGAHGHHVVQAQFGLHAVDLLKGGLGGRQGGEGGGVDAGLLQDLGVVAQAEALNANGEAHGLAFGGVVRQIGVLHPVGVGHIQDVLLPQLIAALAFDHEDVGHLIGLELGPEGAAVVSAAAQGFHADGDTGGVLAVALGEVGDGLVDFHLELEHLNGDLAFGIGRQDRQAQEQDGHQGQGQELTHKNPP